VAVQSNAADLPGNGCEGTAHGNLGELSNLDAKPGYVLKTYDIGAHAGRTVNVRFHGDEDSGESTEWIVDDTALNAK